MTPERVQVLSLGEMADVERQLEPTFEVHRATGADIDGLVARHGPAIRAVTTRGRDRLDAALLARLPSVEIIANFGVGYDSIDLDAAARRGIVVTNTPDVLNDEVADFAVALLLATVRRLPQADRFVRAGRWLQGNFPLAFEVPIVYHSRTARPDVPYRHYPELLAMAKDVDTLLAILPGGPATQGLIDAAVLAALGPDGVLINVARGSVVDEPALVEALRSGTILAAGLDVFADEPRVPQPLLEMDNVVLLPHVGSATRHTRGLMGRLVVDNLLSWFAGRGPLTPVPETPWPRRA